MKNFEKFKTDKKVTKNITLTNKKIKDIFYLIEYDEYSANIIELIIHIIDLKNKLKFYKSVIGKLFFNGKHNASIIEFELKTLNEKINFNLKWYC